MGSNGALKWIFNAENTTDLPSVIDNHVNVYIIIKKVTSYPQLVLMVVRNGKYV